MTQKFKPRRSNMHIAQVLKTKLMTSGNVFLWPSAREAMHSAIGLPL